MFAICNKNIIYILIPNFKLNNFNNILTSNIYLA